MKHTMSDNQGFVLPMTNVQSVVAAKNWFSTLTHEKKVRLCYALFLVGKLPGLTDIEFIRLKVGLTDRREFINEYIKQPSELVVLSLWESWYLNN